jgi:hypothetical protein
MLVFTRYPDQDFTLFTLKGIFNTDEWLSAIQEYADQGLTKFELLDLRKVQLDIELPKNDDIRRILTLVCSGAQFRPPGGRTAIVTNNDVIFGMSRMYDILASMEESITWETVVFHSLSEAVKWLGKDIEKIVLEK